jgi:hypothetical protein
MAEITPIPAGGKLNKVDLTGSAVAATTPGLFANDGQTLLAVIVGATPCNITIQQAPCSHGRSGTQVFACPANKTTVLGPFPQAEYNDGNGKLNYSFDSVATVTIAALRHP